MGFSTLGGIHFFNDQKKAIEGMIRVPKSGARILIADETEKGAGAFCDDRVYVAPVN